MFSLKYSGSEKIFILLFAIYFLIQCAISLIYITYNGSITLFPGAKPENFNTLMILISIAYLGRLFVFIIFFILTKCFFEWKFHIASKLKFIFIFCIYLIFWVSLIFCNLLTDSLYLYLYHPEVHINFGYGFFEFNLFFYKKLGLLGVIGHAVEELKYPFFLLLYMFFLNLSNSKEFVTLSKKLIEKLNILNSKSVILDYANLDQNSDQVRNFKAEDNFDRLNEKSNVFMVKKIDNFHLIHVDDILSLESNGNYLNIDNGHELFPIRTTFKKILENLPQNFFRINRFYIINLLKAQSIEAQTEQKQIKVQLINSRNFIVTKNKEKEFIQHCHDLNLKISNMDCS